MSDSHFSSGYYMTANFLEWCKTSVYILISFTSACCVILHFLTECQKETVHHILCMFKSGKKHLCWCWKDVHQTEIGVLCTQDEVCNLCNLLCVVAGSFSRQATIKYDASWLQSTFYLALDALAACFLKSSFCMLDPWHRNSCSFFCVYPALPLQMIPVTNYFNAISR